MRVGDDKGYRKRQVRTLLFVDKHNSATIERVRGTKVRRLSFQGQQKSNVACSVVVVAICNYGCGVHFRDVVATFIDDRKCANQ